MLKSKKDKKSVYAGLKISKRILNEIKNIQQKPSPMFHAEPLADNLYEWHFTLRGFENSDYDGGLYHGVVILPPEYPMKGPDIRFMTKNGRFKINTNICLSASRYHPEQWTPLWKIRNILESLDAFFLEEGPGIGALKASSKQRKALAVGSRQFFCKVCGKMEDIEKNKMLPRAGEDVKDK